jgi:hypothetical protein
LWYSGVHQNLPHFKGFGPPHARGISTRDDDSGDFPFFQQILGLQRTIQKDLRWLPIWSQRLAQHHSHAWFQKRRNKKKEISMRFPEKSLKYFEILSGFGGLQIAQMVDEQKRCEKNR